MKRKVFFISACMMVAVAIGFFSWPGKRLGWEAFENRMHTALRGHGYVFVAENTVSGSDVMLPLSVTWQRLVIPKRNPVHFQVGFPNSSERFVVRRHNLPNLECYVRYVDGNAVIVEIRSQAAAKEAANELMSILVKEFPEVPFRIASS